ncbi:hypothetical protein BFS30_09920 [Pedobacter steynii]|uniref:Uncharacterized protein n=2 Tax=Pedobacter steynii TaxID=430522 RepID=A0A1D7QFU9_9SPHI|nr:hypothetical protein BFS30_09920 [Pedobacter steynii]
MLFLAACNPFPKKDTHPDLPLLSELLLKKEAFTKVLDYKAVSNISFLKDDRILVLPDHSGLPLKITDEEGAIVFQKVYNFKKPLYLDQEGNLYCNDMKYFYPDYKRMTYFETVVINDSLNNKHAEFELKNPGNDVLNRALNEAYEKEFLEKYHLEPCDFVLVNEERCDVFEIRGNQLVVRQAELIKNDFAKKEQQLNQFDEPVLLRWENSRMVTPEYMYYYQINGELKFKLEEVDMLKFGILKGRTYLDTPYGLFKFQSNKL